MYVQPITPLDCILECYSWKGWYDQKALWISQRLILYFHHHVHIFVPQVWFHLHLHLLQIYRWGSYILDDSYEYSIASCALENTHWLATEVLNHHDKQYSSYRRDSPKDMKHQTVILLLESTRDNQWPYWIKTAIWLKLLGVMNFSYLRVRHLKLVESFNTLVHRFSSLILEIEEPVPKKLNITIYKTHLLLSSATLHDKTLMSNLNFQVIYCWFGVVAANKN